MAEKLEDLDPVFSKGGKKKEVDTSELEALDPVFTKDPPRFQQNKEISVQELPQPYRMVRKALMGEGDIDEGIAGVGGLLLGAGAGAAEQTRNVMGLFKSPKAGPVATAPPSGTSAYEKWLKNWAGIERVGPGGVPEGAQTYQRVKTHGKAGQEVFKRFGNMPLDISRQADIAQEAAGQARRSGLSNLARGTSRGLGYIPGLSMLAGTSGGVDIARALQRAEEGDTLGALIQGIGGTGALASLLPHPVPRLIGGGLSLAAMPAIYYYDLLRGKREPEAPVEQPPVMSP